MRRTARTDRPATDPVADPFGERLRRCHRRRFDLLGGRFHFDSNHCGALRLADDAFGGFARRRGLAAGPVVRVSLRVAPRRTLAARAVPPAPRFRAASGLVCATVDADNYAVVCPEHRSALVVLSQDMLQFPYHARYELIEFAVYTLATRALGLVPVHAACIGRRGGGLLLMGDSGAGKSTLSLLGALRGMTVHAEDVSFIDAARMQAWTVPSYLHVHRDALRWVTDQRTRSRLRRSTTITRRGGARKLELDLRRLQHAHGGPVPLQAVVFLGNPARRGNLAPRPLTVGTLRARLRRTQPFARTHPGWQALAAGCSRLPAYELPREPQAARMVNWLSQLLRPQGAKRRGAAVRPR